MKRANVPFNIRILQLTPDKLKMIKPVTSLDIFDQTKVNFHEEGLYSISIFGRVGDPLRSKRFSYINIKLPVFHPIIWRAIHRLKSLYTEIMEGTSYAVWDSDAKDFVKSTPVDGETGYAVGVSGITENNKWIYKAAATGNSRGNFGGGIAVGFQWK